MNKLINKVEKEYEYFKNNILKLDKNIIFMNAYKITIYTEAYELLTNEDYLNSLSKEKIKSLNDEIGVIDHIWENWLGNDYISIVSLLEECIV